VIYTEITQPRNDIIFDDVKSNKRLIAKVLLAVTSKNPTFCIGTCLWTPSCKSVNFNTVTLLCEILGESLAEDPGLQLEDVDGWIHYDQSNGSFYINHIR